MYDLIIRNGTIVDGTGRRAATSATSPSTDGVIVGRRADRRRPRRPRRSTPTGCSSRPGFVDIHTHYDGQATWDDVLDPSRWHGVTTVVMGNCGVGFAPVRPGPGSDWLIELMEGVEDIPGTALAEGIDVGLGDLPRVPRRARRAGAARIDVGTQVPHGAVRAYVMGERGAAQRAGHRPTTSPRWPRSCAEAHRGRRARLLDLPHARPPGHRRRAGARHLRRRGRAVRHRPGAGRASAPGVFELAPGRRIAARTSSTPSKEIDWMRRLGARDRPAGHLRPPPGRPGARPVARADGRCRSRPSTTGPSLRPQVAARPFGLLIGLPDQPPVRQAPDLHGAWPTCRSTSSSWPLQATPVRKAAILAEADAAPDPNVLFDGIAAFLRTMLDRIFLLGDPPDYEPTPETSIAGIAEATGRRPVRGALRPHARRRRPELPDAAALQLRRRQPRGHPGDAAAPRRPCSAWRDGGAHCGMICDASLPTYCSPTGPATATGARSCRSSGWSRSRPRTRPSSTGSPTGARSRPACRPTSTSSTTRP